jgi:hypothetical protein
VENVKRNVYYRNYGLFSSSRWFNSSDKPKSGRNQIRGRGTLKIPLHFHIFDIYLIYKMRAKENEKKKIGENWKD